MGKKNCKQRGRPQNPAGDYAEKIFEEGLKLLLKSDSFFRNYHHARKNGELDKIQIDFLLFCGNEKDALIAIPFQIKGGGHAREAIEQHWQKHPGVAPFGITGKDKEKPLRVAKRVQNRAYRYIRNLFLRNPALRKRTEKLFPKTQTPT